MVVCFCYHFLRPSETPRDQVRQVAGSLSLEFRGQAEALH